MRVVSVRRGSARRRGARVMRAVPVRRRRGGMRRAPVRRRRWSCRRMVRRVRGRARRRVRRRRGRRMRRAVSPMIRCRSDGGQERQCDCREQNSHESHVRPPPGSRGKRHTRRSRRRNARQTRAFRPAITIVFFSFVAWTDRGRILTGRPAPRSHEDYDDASSSSLYRDADLQRRRVAARRISAERCQLAVVPSENTMSPALVVEFWPWEA